MPWLHEKYCLRSLWINEDCYLIYSSIRILWKQSWACQNSFSSYNKQNCSSSLIVTHAELIGIIGVSIVVILLSLLLSLSLLFVASAIVTWVEASTISSSVKISSVIHSCWTSTRSSIVGTFVSAIVLVKRRLLRADWRPVTTSWVLASMTLLSIFWSIPVCFQQFAMVSFVT